MRAGRGDIWHGDLVRAFAALEPDEQTRTVVAHLLGFAPAAEAGSAPASSVADPVDRRPVATPPRAAPAAAPAEPLIERVRRLPPRLATAPAATTIQPLRLSAPAVAQPPAAAPSLLRARAARFIVKELVASTRAGPEIDMDRLVGALANREIPDPVPLEQHLTLARGVQVLVDRGEGMEPFAGDQADIVALLGTLVDDALIDVRDIHEMPDTEDALSPWEPPSPGIPVLVLTDLALGGRDERTPSELVAGWRVVAATLSGRGSAIVALVPYSKDEWPPALRGLMTVIPWDRSTTAGTARRLRNAGARR